VPLDDGSAYRETHPHPVTFRMQALKRFEYSFQVICVDTTAVIPNGEDPFIRLLSRGNLDLGRTPATVPQRVLEQPLENLSQAIRIARDAGQFTAGHLGRVLAQFAGQSRERVSERYIHPSRLERRGFDVQRNRIACKAVRQ